MRKRTLTSLIFLLILGFASPLRAQGVVPIFSGHLFVSMA